MKLVKVVKSSNPEKKYDAVFETDGREKKVSFGATGYTDFTKPETTEETKKRYLTRHQARENWNKPDTAGALSRHLLWGPTKSLESNVQIFKRKFELH